MSNPTFRTRPSDLAAGSTTGRAACAVCLALALVTLGAPPAAAQLDMPRTSPAASVSQVIGVTEVTIDYHRPAVRERTVWGALVPYGEVWRAGANDRTTFTVSDDVEVEGEPLPAGTYGLLAIPETGAWTLIFSEVADAWGAFDYSPDNDALRVRVTPEEGPPREWLQYGFEHLGDDSATAVLHWDRLKVPFTISVDLDDTVAAGIREVVRWEYPYQAASWALERGEHLDEAMTWTDASIALERNFWNLAAKARLHAAAGDLEEAVDLGEEALDAAEAMENPPPEAYRARLAEELDDWRR